MTAGSLITDRVWRFKCPERCVSNARDSRRSVRLSALAFRQIQGPGAPPPSERKTRGGPPPRPPLSTAHADAAPRGLAPPPLWGGGPRLGPCGSRRQANTRKKIQAMPQSGEVKHRNFCLVDTARLRRGPTAVQPPASALHQCCGLGGDSRMRLLTSKCT